MTNEERLCQRWRSFAHLHDEYRRTDQHTRARGCVDSAVDWFEGYAMAMRDAGYFDAASDALFLSSLAINRDAIVLDEIFNNIRTANE